MNLLQLRYFCDAASTQNFSKTAERFFVPPSGISQSIRRLEAELDIQLFERRYNKVVLTYAGRRFYSKVVTALSLIDDAELEARCSDRISGEIKLLIFCNRRLVTHAIEEFKAAYPHVNFVLKHERGSDLDCDILITDDCPSSFLKYRMLAEEDILLAMSKMHALASRDQISVRELFSERFISMPEGRSLYRLTTEICKSEGFIPNISIQTDDPYYVRKYVELGLGIAFIPSCSWDGLFSEDVILKNIGNYKRSTFVCLPQKRNVKAAVDAFLRYLR